jgi:hypothetical protein
MGGSEVRGMADVTKASVIPNRNGPQGTRDALLQSNPASAGPNVSARVDRLEHQIGDHEGRITAIEGLFTPDDQGEDLA